MDMPVFKEYSRYYPLIYKNRNYVDEAKFVYRWADKPLLIIDLGCGTGGHHKHWDCAIIGIDQSAGMLRQAHSHKRRIYVKANIEILPEGFCGHTCYTALFNVIGYCKLEKVIAHLNQPKGGIFIFDVWDMGKCEKEGFRKRVKRFSWGQVEVCPYRNESKEAILEIVVKPKKGKEIREYHNVLPYSMAHIERLCREYGYRGERKDTKTWTTWYKLTKER